MAGEIRIEVEITDEVGGEGFIRIYEDDRLVFGRETREPIKVSTVRRWEHDIYKPLEEI